MVAGSDSKFPGLFLREPIPLSALEVDGGVFGYLLPAPLRRSEPPPSAIVAPLPRTPRRASISLEGTFGAEAEPVDYFEHQHETWERMLSTQAQLVRGRCAPQYARGRECIDAFAHRIPSLRELDTWLECTTGWRIVRANGYVEPRTFLSMLAKHQFPCMDQLRHSEELFYSPEPDMYHDIIGHLPMLLDPQFSEYYVTFGRAGANARHGEQLQALNRIYWFTMEFGLLRAERGEEQPLAYGAALLTGLAELMTASSPYVSQSTFSIERAIVAPTDIHRVNEVLFVTASFDELLSDFVDWAKQEHLL